MVMACIIQTNGTVIFAEHATDMFDIQRVVGGCFEMFPMIAPGHHAYINEDAKELQLPVNEFATELAHLHRRLENDVIRGDVIIFGSLNAPDEGPVTNELLHRMASITDGLDDVTIPS